MTNWQSPPARTPSPAAEIDILDDAIDLYEGKAPEPAKTLTSAKGIALIHSFEQCKLDAYPDPGSRDGNPWTVGWGSTGPDIRRGTVWTQEQADARFEQHLAKLEQDVVRVLDGAATTQDQFDALVSFAYNVGVGAKGLGGSTLLRKHHAGDYGGAAAEFSRWDKNDGRRMRGLTRRRLAEAALYRGLA